MSVYNRDVRQDVRELGALLGDVLEAQASREAFETVESVRNAAIDYREGKLDSRAGLEEIISSLPPERASVVARAFTTYFELINLAEERERVRAIRDASQEGVVADSLEEVVNDLSDENPATVQQIFEDVLVEPTFTAHPTEARRKTVKAKLRSVATHLETLDERTITDTKSEQVWRDIEAEVTSLWQTPQVRSRPPEPTDEAWNVQWYLENTLFDVVGEVYGELEDAVDETFDDIDVPKLFEFRSWAGSDRDGNPFVTPDVTAKILDRQRRIIIDRYQDRLKELSGALSQDCDHVDVGDDVKVSLKADRERLPNTASEARKRYPNELYRQKLEFMRERVQRVHDVRSGGYTDAAELREDLEVLAADLRANDADVVAEAHVDPVVREVSTFGFSLAGLDLRDHQTNHTKAVAEAFARAGVEYASLDETKRIDVLTDAILQDTTVVDVGDVTDVSETTARVLERFDALSEWQREYGVEAIDTYCISMTEEPSHVLEVLFLADQAGVVDLPGHCGLDVVPLLETEAALSGARRIMGTLFENEAYKQALAARDDVQEVMLGYSDSNKENGFLAANWSLYENQRRLADICDDHDVTMRLFHGRGGSISRGGGPMNDALLALPNRTVTGQVKFTEQGEAIAEKYANPRVAERNIEQMLNAQLKARKEALERPEENVSDEWLTAMDTMADAAREEYRDLLETDGFVSYFEQVTPITVIEDLNLGSRPASRSGKRRVEDLRAIPWVFSWTQARCILPGWYSLGVGIEAYLQDGGDVETLQAMYDDWSFFRTILDNAALALARTDLEIASEYAALADEDLCERFLPRLSDEYERTTDLVTTIAGRDDLYSREWFGESLRRRNPYVDPLNLLQVELLAQDTRTEREEQILRVTVKGIAAGMKNTG